MSVRKERLELIRERHRTLILANRERIRFEAMDDAWDEIADDGAEEQLASRYEADDDYDE